MAKIHSIEPFPADIDRDYFGAWLSGFTDGEGCFFMGWIKNPSGDISQIQFNLKLRDDDLRSIKLIQSFWQCGVVKFCRPYKNGKQTASIRVSKISSLHDIIVPHFERYPLFAKKGRDFGIWKQAVRFCYRIKLRRLTFPGNGGALPKWTATERAQFEEFRTALKNQRIYSSPPVEIIQPLPERTLYD